MESRHHNDAARIHALDRFRFRARMVAIGSTMDHSISVLPRRHCAIVTLPAWAIRMLEREVAEGRASRRLVAKPRSRKLLVNALEIEYWKSCSRMRPHDTD